MSNSRYLAGTWLSKAIGVPTKTYLPDEARKLIYDWQNLREIFLPIKDDLQLYDWSCLVVPMCKAIESVLTKIAEDCGLNIEGSDKLGSFFDEANIEQNIDTIIKKVPNKTKKEEIKQILSEMKVFLRRYRHIPMHHSQRLENFEQADTASSAALHNIGSLVRELLSLEVIKINTSPATESIEDEAISLDDIPF